MGREIKFRAWDKINKILTKTFGLSDLHYTTADDGIHFGEAFACFPFYDLRDFVLMQFTGLHDKNGKEIYEGDILRREFEVFEVMWCEAGYDSVLAFHAIGKNKASSNHYYGGWNGNDMEVIGNIHENPELLRE